MTNIDQFESVFKAAARTPFEYQPPEFRRITVVTDRDAEFSRLFAEQLKRFLRVLVGQHGPQWQILDGDQIHNVSQLCDLVRQQQPDLICTYRNLRMSSREHPYSLGVFVDVLTQTTSSPVLLWPDEDHSQTRSHEGTRCVMAITDHLVGDLRLVNMSTRFTEPPGTLWLTHLEDDAVFERYMAAIAKIPTINTDEARETIRQQLLKEPGDYIRSCREVLRSVGLPIDVEQVVTMGHHLSEYRRLIEEHDVDLLVMNTKDQDQMAMHGLAYPLAVELRHIPLLLL